MSLPMSPSVPHRLVPSEYEPDDPGAPVYLISPATLMQRAEYRSTLSGFGVRHPSDAEFFAALRDGLKAVEAEADLAVLDTVESVAAQEGALLDEATAKRMAHLRQWAAEYVPAFGALLRQRLRFDGVSTVLAAQMFLRGWENVNLTFARKDGVVPMDLLDQLPEEHVKEISDKAFALMSVTRAHAKNSVSPPRSKGAPAPSPAASAPPTAVPDGTSTENSTN